MHPSIKKILTEAIQQTPSADNSQPWKILWHKNTLTIRYDEARVKAHTFPADNPATLLCMGAAIENLNQALSAYNIQAIVHSNKVFSLNDPIYYTLEILNTTDCVKIPDSPIPLFQRHTNRWPYQAQAIPQETVEKLNNLASNSLNIRVLEKHSDIVKICQLVRSASEIRFRTREINEWLGKSFRFGKEADTCGDGLDVSTLDLPLGGSLFLRLVSDWQRMKWLNKLGAYKFMSFIDSLPIKNAPALVAITGKQGFENSLSAGRLLQKLWIDLNAQGIAVHPYYVISDQINRYQDGAIPKGLEWQAEQVYEDTTRMFKLENNETLHMLFRIGYPKKTVKRSKRLPLTILSNIC